MDGLSVEEVLDVLLGKGDVLEQRRFGLLPDGELATVLPVGTAEANLPFDDVATAARTHANRCIALSSRDDTGVYFRMRLLQEILEHSENVLFQLFRCRLPLMYLFLNNPPQSGKVRTTKSVRENAIQLASERCRDKGLPFLL